MLSLGSLPFKNLKRYAGRTAALVMFFALMTVAVFGGGMMILGVRGGLDTVLSRLGADIMVTPENAKNEFDAQTVLIKAEPGYFYMDASVVDAIRGIDGVEAASPQLFLASAKAGCCSARVQMIAFDPATDFTVTPWLRDTHLSGEMGLMDVVIGSNVDLSAAASEGVILFYDRECRVVGQFAPTGSTLDSAVYMTFDTCRELIRASRDKGMFKYEDLDADHSVSSVMVRVKKGYDVGEVAASIREKAEGVSVATATGMVTGIADSLRRIGGTVNVLIAVVWCVGLGMTVLIFILMMNARRREFASLRAMGADRGILSGIVVKEALITSLAGGTAGILLSLMLLYPFRALLAQLIGTGIVLPSLPRAAALAACALVSVLLPALSAALVTIKRFSRMDAGYELKEGE